MSNKKIVLITGVAGYWGSRVAERLIAINDNWSGSSEETVLDEFHGYHVIGIDNEPPAEPIKGLDFIRSDIRNSLLVNLLGSEKVHTVIHLAFQETHQPSEWAFDFNVIGTMKILGAAAEAGVRKVILRSSTTVYGAHQTNPAFLMEHHPLSGTKTNGTIRNLAEIEAFCNGFRRQVPDMSLTVLRFPNIIGPSVDSPMTRLLNMNPTPILLGFDPLMQIIHEDDVIGALLYSVKNDIPYAVNVASEGIMPLAKILRLTGKLSLPVFHMCAYWGTGLLKVSGLNPHRVFPIDLDYLRYPWVADLARMREKMGFVPTYTAEETLREYAGYLRLQRYKPQATDLIFDEENLRDTIERRRRVREAQTAQTIEAGGGDE